MPDKLTPYGDTRMPHTSFWEWAGFAVLGLITLFFVPGQSRMLAMVVILLGGGAYIYITKGSNGLANLGSQLTGGKTDG